MNAPSYALLAEWFDPSAQIVRELVLSYFDDGSLELLDQKTKKIFLKRTPCPSVKPTDLFLNNTVTVFARQLNLVGFANEATKRKLRRSNQKGFCVINTNGYQQIGQVLGELQMAGYTLSKIKMARLSNQDARKFVDLSGSDMSFGDKLTLNELLGDAVVFIEFVEAATQRKDQAQKLSSKTATYFTADKAEKMGELAFQTLSLPTTACFDNCTLCVIRPHAIREGRLGPIVAEILKQGFEVSALQSFLLDKPTANEFYDVYRGVLTDYEDILSDLASGILVALEVRGENIVETFREWSGAHDPAIAKILQPNSIRARFGTNLVKSAIHCTDLPEDGLLECQFFFKVLHGI